MLIAREADIAIHRVKFELFTKGHFEIRKNFLSMKDSDAAAIVTALGVHLTAGAANPAALIPSAQSNYEFFRMTPLRIWDYASAYTAARTFYGIPEDASGRIIAATQHIQLLGLIDRNIYSRPSTPLPEPVAAQPEETIVLFTAELPCEKNSQELTFASKAFLRELSIRSRLFPYAKIIVRGGASADEANSAWLAGARETAVKDIIARSCGAGYSRIYSAGGTPETKTAATVTFTSAGFVR